MIRAVISRDSQSEKVQLRQLGHGLFSVSIHPPPNKRARDISPSDIASKDGLGE